MRISIGIFAYNEAGSIGPLLETLLAQDTQALSIDEIIVVSFGSTDGTDVIVTSLSERNPQIRLITHPVCLGKAASVSRYLALASGEILVLLSADTEIRARDTLSRLVEPFLVDPQLVIAGARHRTINHRGGFVSFAGQTLWSLLDAVSVIDPKISGDLMALRAGIITEIPEGILNDDAYLELSCTARGLKKHYCRNAEIFIRIPETFRDYVIQRRRIYTGHRQLKKYLPRQQLSTMKLLLLLRLLARRVDSVQTLGYALVLMLVDAGVRFHSLFEEVPVVYRGGIWPTVRSTKFTVPATAATSLSGSGRGQHDGKGTDNVYKQELRLRTAQNLGLLMRAVYGAGTPRRHADRKKADGGTANGLFGMLQSGRRRCRVTEHASVASSRAASPADTMAATTTPETSLKKYIHCLIQESVRTVVCQSALSAARAHWTGWNGRGVPVVGSSGGPMGGTQTGLRSVPHRTTAHLGKPQPEAQPRSSRDAGARPRVGIHHERQRHRRDGPHAPPPRYEQRV